MKKRLFTLVVIALFFVGCSSLTHNVPKEAFEDGPTLAAHTSIQEKLMALPEADHKIVVSVYEFDDQTGQNKPAEYAQYSRAVTQGGLSIVKKALIDAANHGWFRVLERGGLQNLLQERKIIRSTRTEHPTPNGGHLPQLGPLLYSGVLLEGGIVSYESNVVSGGAGAAYLGIGGSSKYSRDMVTVYLRLVSVKTGEVLLSVNSSKTIYSYGMQGGIFKFVSFDELVEGEAGYTLNEPPQLAVRQAIEMSVYAMIMEGYKNGLWKFKNREAGQAAWLQYYNKYVAPNTGKIAESEPVQTAQAPKIEKPKTQMAQKMAPQQKSSMQKKPTLQPTKTKTTVAPKVSTQVASRKPPKAPAMRKVKQTPPSSPKIMADNWRDAPDVNILEREELERGWYVKVLAVPELGAEERQIVRELERAGLKPVVEKVSVYYRILVGAYPNTFQALSVQRKLMGLSNRIGIPEESRIYSLTRI